MSRHALPGYRLRRLVHRGHSFEVYDAWSEERCCPVVVKRTRPGASADACARLAREGRTLLSLAHPHLVRAYEVHRADRVSIVLETLPGQTLDHLFHACGPLRASDVVSLGRQLASVLCYLHRHDLVHADLKPGNVVVHGGLVRLIDLSLAGRPRWWRSSAGTPGYVAPEQANRRRVTAATDVWGLGLLLLEASAGRDPYPVGDPRYREGHGPIAAPQPLRPSRRAPDELRSLVAAMTAFEPADRPCMDDVRARLDQMPGGESA
jgi:eukaryotic-like serine/threonine-protein kinase